MKNRQRSPLSLLVFTIAFVSLTTFALTRAISTIRAEQSGGSPSAGADSRIKQLSDGLEALNYGDPDEEVLGNWGTYLNRISSAAYASFSDAQAKGLTNGGVANFPSELGGVHDDAIGPPGTYQATWTVCNSGNEYCGTEDDRAEKRDENTGLIWSARISSSANWFTANNCLQPSNGVAPQGPDACSANGNPGCICVKLTGENKTGCEALGEGWRLPYQKETMMAYIDGSSAQLSNAAAFHWSSATNSGLPSLPGTLP